MAAELISLATILTGAGGGVLVPFLNKILGPSADELGVTIAEHARIYRLKNTFSLFKKASDMAAHAGFEPQQVSVKTLLPLLEGASLEEAPTLSDKWAALLANAADPSNKLTIKPAYAEILRQLTTEEALLLDQIFESVQKMNPAVSGVDTSKSPLTHDEYWRSLAVSNTIPLKLFRQQRGLSKSAEHEFNALADNLLRQRLLIAANRTDIQSGIGSHIAAAMNSMNARPEMDKAYLSALGFDFMLACMPPQPE